MTTQSIPQSDLNPTANPTASNLPGLAAQIARETLLVHTAPLAIDTAADWERVWSLRAKAQDMRAHTIGDIQAKAAIIAGELQRDDTALDSNSPGSALKLIESLLYDLMSMRLDA